MWDREVVCDNTRSREVLGIEYTDLADSIREMGESMIAKGVVPDRRPKFEIAFDENGEVSVKSV